MKTLYELLGVDPDASDEALRTAYRRLAKKHHPDLNPDDPDAARRFRQLAGAIAILGDARKRATYDQRLLRELLRRLGGERKQPRLRSRNINAINAVAAVVMGIILMQDSALVRPISPTSIVTSETTSDVMQRLDWVATAKQESMSRERSNNTIQVLASAVPPPRASTNNLDAVSVRPEKPTDISETDWRELRANERAALVRQAQELQASGDAQGAHVLLQRACRGSRPRCAPGAREAL